MTGSETNGGSARADTAYATSDGTTAGSLRRALADRLAADGFTDAAWRHAVETVPREAFVPGFYLPGGVGEHGLTRWEPVTAATGGDRWLRAVYSDETLITQFDGEEPDWTAPVGVRLGGAPTSSATLPSLVVRMWLDADLRPDDDILEIGTGTGYSAALAEQWREAVGGAGSLTSVDVDPHRLGQAAGTLFALGYVPTVAVADGLYGYWPKAPYDRIVAACSVRRIPPAWIAQTRPGGKILSTLGGWLNGYARVLLTVDEEGTAAGPFLPGDISFMAARAHQIPRAGNPADWRDLLKYATARPAVNDPGFLVEATGDAVRLRFLAQLAVPDAQLLLDERGTPHLVDVTSGSAAAVIPADGGWSVLEAGPVRLWTAVEHALDAWITAGRPPLEEFEMRIGRDGSTWVGVPAAPGCDFRL